MSETHRSSSDPLPHSAAPGDTRSAATEDSTLAQGTEPESDALDPEHDRSRPAGRGRRILKWITFVAGLIFFLGVLREAMDPFGDKPYVEISHGDHVHYVPEDRDPNVSISRFPRTEPESDERITPDGRIVKKE